MSALSTATKSINAAVTSLTTDGPVIDAGERAAALAACDRLRAELIGPVEALFDITLVTYKTAAVRIAIGMGLFNTMAAANGEAMSAEELSTKTGADALLIVRVMHMLVNMKMFKETSDTKYQLLPLGGAFVTGSPIIDMMVHLESHMEASLRLPEYLESIQYATPKDAYHGPWQYAMHTDQHYFDWLKEHPNLQTAFNSAMAAQNMIRPEDWFDYYPVSEKLRADNPNDVLLVDVGGGKGADLVGFKTKHPSIAAKLVLQDLPAVIDDIKDPLPAGIEAQKYDFFQPQPVLGAKAYYLRTVLHDWPDEQAVQILTNIRAAMGRDSVLLVNEGCIAHREVPLFKAQLDFNMMLVFASLERTEEQWERLLERAGLKMVGMYRPKTSDTWNMTLFEAVLA